MNLATQASAGRRPEPLGRRDLHDRALAHHRHLRADRERLGHVVRDVERRLPDLVEEVSQLDDEPVVERAVERAEWLVEQQHPGRRRQRPREGDALALAARERADRPLLAALEPDEGEQLGDPRRGRSAGQCPASAGRRRRLRRRRGAGTARRPGT